jgi:hypothetical protein
MECEIGECHDRATTPVSVLGMLRFVCDRHACGLPDDDILARGEPGEPEYPFVRGDNPYA